LIAITSQESQAIVEGRLTDLKDVVERKHEALARLADLETRRMRWLQGYAEHRSDDQTDWTLSGIIAQSTPRDRRILDRLQRGLTHSVEQLKELNQRTCSLLNAILGSIDSSLRYLLSDDAWGPTYGAHGALQNSPIAARQLLDRQA